MKTKEILVGRRQVLRGAGGFTLGLPFLASIATPRLSLAQPTPGVRRRFAAVLIGHGNIKPENMYPSQATPRSETLFSGHVIRSGPLAPSREGGRVFFSQALQAPADLLSERLVSKMNILRAIDYPFFSDHTTGSPLGNFARSGDPSEFKGEDPRETIDSVLGWSRTFYDNLDGLRERVFLVGTAIWANELSWRHSSPATRSGPIVAVRAENDVGRAWDRLFQGYSAPTATTASAPPPKPVIDLVLEDYRRLRRLDARLSAADAQRLDDHIDRMSELERKVNALRTPSGSAVRSGVVPSRVSIDCGKSSSCTGDPRRYMDVFTDLIAAGFITGATRVAVLNQSQNFVASFSGDWHQQVAHTGNQTLLCENNRNTFAYAVTLLAKKLDIEEANGRTYLDNSLIMFGNENGYNTHWGTGIPIVTFGSAGGFFRTGQLVDLRRDERDPRGHGITYNQWLAIVLQSMGLPRSEFERNGQQGYGRMKIGKTYQGKYVPDAISEASRVPDTLRAG